MLRKTTLLTNSLEKFNIWRTPSEMNKLATRNYGIPKVNNALLILASVTKKSVMPSMLSLTLLILKTD